MNIIPNFLVVALQVIPFLVTIIGLYQIIFKPMLAYLSARDAATEGARAEAQALEAKVAEQLADYEARLAAAHAQQRSFRAERRAVALQGYSAQIESARKAAEGRVAEALEALTVEQTAARAALRGTAVGLADDISRRVLHSLAG